MAGKGRTRRGGRAAKFDRRSALSGAHAGSKDHVHCRFGEFEGVEARARLNVGRAGLKPCATARHPGRPATTFRLTLADLPDTPLYLIASSSRRWNLFWSGAMKTIRSTMAAIVFSSLMMLAAVQSGSVRAQQTPPST